MSLHRAYRLLGYILLALLLLLLVITLLTPIIAKHQIKSWAAANGAQQVELRGLYLNIWTGQIEIERFSAQATDQPQLQLQGLEVDINYPALGQKRFQVDRITIDQGQLPVVKNADNWQLGPIHLPAPAPEEEEAEDNEQQSVGWQWGLNRVEINQLAMSLDAADQHHELTIEYSSLKLLRNWLPNERSFLVANGTLNGSSFTIDSFGKPLDDNASGDLTINIDQLDLAPLVSFWLPDFAGVLSADMVLVLERTGTGFTISQQGWLQLDNHRFKQDELELAANQLTWQGKINTQLNADGLQQLNTDGKATLAGLDLKQDELELATKQLTWQGKTDTRLNAQGLQQLNTDGEATLAGLDLKQGDMVVTSEHISLQGKNNLAIEDDKLRLDNDTTLTLQQPHFQQQTLGISTKQLQWQGRMEVNNDSDGLDNVTTDGSLDIADLDLQQKEQQLQLRTGQISLTGRNQLTLVEQQPVIDNESSLVLQQLNLQHPTATVEEQQLNWDGTLNLNADQQLSVEGRLSAADTLTQAVSLIIASTDSQWQGRARIDTAAGLQQLSGDLETHRLAVQSDDKQPLVSVDAVIANSLAMEGTDRIKLASFKADGIVLTHDQQALLELASASATEVQLRPELIAVDQVTLGASQAKLVLNEQKQPEHWLQWLAQLQGQDGSQVTDPQQPASQASVPPTDQAEPAEDSSPQLKIGKIQLSEPATIAIRDRSANNAEINLRLTQLAVEQLNSADNTPSPFNINARINRFGEVDMKGKYTFLGDQMNGSWEGTISGLELTPFSPYMVEMSGYQINSGQLSLTTQGSIENREVKSSNNFQAHRLVLDKSREKREEGAQQQSGMPLDMALGLLTDDDDNVELNIPVSGSVDDPKFGYQSVINIVLAKAAQEAAVSYLTTYLQPYGTVFSVGSFLFNNLSKSSVKLEPVEFLPGLSTLTPKAEGYLGKITSLLKDKSALRLNLCGYTVTDDIQALEQQQAEQLTEEERAEDEAASDADIATGEQSPITGYELKQLAEERSTTVKQYLIDQGIEQERLFFCLPEIRTDNDQPPGVLLGI